MHRSRSLSVILLGVVITALILTGCSKDDSASSNGGTHELVGSWRLTSANSGGVELSTQDLADYGFSITFTFNSDNTATGNVMGTSGSGTWSTSGSQLTLSLANTLNGTYSVSGNTFTFSFTDENGTSQIWRFTKQ